MRCRKNKQEWRSERLCNGRLLASKGLQLVWMGRHRRFYASWFVARRFKLSTFNLRMREYLKFCGKAHKNVVTAGYAPKIATCILCLRMLLYSLATYEPLMWSKPSPITFPCQDGMVIIIILLSRPAHVATNSERAIFINWKVYCWWNNSQSLHTYIIILYIIYRI